MATSAKAAGEPAVAVALAADATPQQLSGEPDLAAAARGIVAELAAKLACVRATEQTERQLADAALGHAATAGQPEGARSG